MPGEYCQPTLLSVKEEVLELFVKKKKTENIPKSQWKRHFVDSDHLVWLEFYENVLRTHVWSGKRYIYLTWHRSIGLGVIVTNGKNLSLF